MQLPKTFPESAIILENEAGFDLVGTQVGEY